MQQSLKHPFIFIYHYKIDNIDKINYNRND